MITDITLLSEEAKIWIYPSSRKFYTNELEEIELKAQEILDNYNFQFRKEIKKRNKKTMEAFERSLNREQIEWAIIAAGNGD